MNEELLTPKKRKKSSKKGPRGETAQGDFASFLTKKEKKGLDFCKKIKRGMG